MRRGFTLVEVMIVVAIIALLAAISIPNLLRARLNANEGTAIAAMTTLSTAQQTWRTSNTNFASSLGNLSNATPPYIDSVLGTGLKQGYSFSVTTSNATGFVAIANPQSRGRTGNRSFCVAEDGVVRFQANTDYNNTAATCTGSVIE